MAIENEIKEVQKWHSRLSTSNKLRTRQGKRYKWEGNTEQYKGRYREIEAQFDIPLPIIQLTFAYIKTELPRLYLRDPHIKVNPKKKSSIQSAKILEKALNYIWRRKRFKQQIKKNIIDGKLVGHSWFKTGYTGKFGTVEDSDGNVMEFIESEDFFGYRVPWKHMYFDVDSVSPPHDSAWIAHEFWLPLDDVKKDSRYSHTDLIKGSPKDRVNPDDIIKNANDIKSDVLMARLFEFWDIKNEKKFVIADGVDRYIQKPIKWPYKLKGYPFSYLNFHPINDEAYGIPDVFMIQDQMMEQIKLRAQQIDHVKRFNRQLVTEPNNLDDENKSLLAEGITGAVVEAKKGAGSIAPIAYPPVPQDTYAIEDRIVNDRILVSGQNPIESGAPAKAPTRTIREVIEQQAGSENRRSEQIDVIEDFIEDISQNIIGLLQQYADAPFYVAVTGEDPRSFAQQMVTRPSAVESPEDAVTTTEGFTFTKKDIQGEFDVDVVAGSTVPLNKGAVLEILQQIAPLTQQLGAVPGGPVAGAVASIFGDLLELPEIKIALEQEFRVQQQSKEQANEQAQEQQQLESANEAAQTQMQAERIQTQKEKNLYAAALGAAQLRQKEKESIRSTRKE